MIMDDDEFWQRAALAALQSGASAENSASIATKLTALMNAELSGQPEDLIGEPTKTELKANCTHCKSINVLELYEHQLQMPSLMRQCSECGCTYIINPAEELCSR